MKNKNKNELWVQNLDTSDRKIHDLGVKVPAGKTINIYAFNPRLTAAEVGLSMKSGDLARRTAAGILRVVERKVKVMPKDLLKVGVSKKPVMAKKGKSSIYIDPNDNELVTEDGSFDFADYGISDIDTTTKKEAGSVMIRPPDKVDVKPEDEPTVSPKLKLSKDEGAVVVEEVKVAAEAPTEEPEKATVEVPAVMEPAVEAKDTAVVMTFSGPAADVTMGDEDKTTLVKKKATVKKKKRKKKVKKD